MYVRFGGFFSQLVGGGAIQKPTARRNPFVTFLVRTYFKYLLISVIFGKID
jgi:hypothetical protein